MPSPPVTFQVTFAAPPPVSVAENCSTEAPLELVALQPVQLVSMVEVPGEMAKVPFEEVMVAVPPPQPAIRIKTGMAAA